MSSNYTPYIKDATGCDDATAALIEDVMRCNRTGLDHLTATEFATEAREINAELRADPWTARFIAEASQLTVPTWAA